MRVQTRTNHRRGTVLVYIAVAMIAFCALVSLAVDVAHLRLIKTQLQGAADAAARAAAAALTSGSPSASAVAAAGANTADGTAVVLNAATDVKVGTWSGGTFTVGGASPNAVRVTARRTAARGNATTLWWGGLIGMSSADLHVSAIATGKATPMAGFIGFNTITFKNNTFIGSYDSKSNKNPNQASAGSKSRAGSNGSITGNNNDTLQGDAVLGPSGSISGVTVTGSDLYQGSAIPAPTLPTWTPVNPTAYTVSSDTTLPGGSYWYTSLTVNANLTFSGPAVVYVNGDVVVGGALTAASGVPNDLTIYQYGSNAFGDGAANGMDITANVIAPNSDFTAKNNLNFYGSAIFNSITTKNNANFFYDLELGAANGSPAISTVQ